MRSKAAAAVRDVLRRLLGDRAATDPILVIAAIAVSLVLLVGGSFAVAGIIANGQDLNARNDLQLLATAQAAAQAHGGGFASYARTPEGVESGDDADAARPGVQLLSQLEVGFSLSDGTEARVVACEDGWLAATRSKTGQVYLRSSADAADYVAPADTMPLPDCADSTDVAGLLTALGDPGGEAGGPQGPICPTFGAENTATYDATSQAEASCFDTPVTIGSTGWVVSLSNPVYTTDGILRSLTLTVVETGPGYLAGGPILLLHTDTWRSCPLWKSDQVLAPTVAVGTSQARSTGTCSLTANGTPDRWVLLGYGQYGPGANGTVWATGVTPIAD